MNPDGQKTTFVMPRDLHKRLKIRAAEEKRTIDAVVTEALTDYLRAHGRETGDN